MSRKYIFAPEKGKLYDFFAILNMSTRFNIMKERFASEGFNKGITNTYARLVDRIKTNYSNVKLFWESENRNHSFFYHLFSHMLIKVESIDEILEAFKAYEPIDLAVELLYFYDNKNKFTKPFYKLLIKDKELLMEFLNGLNLSAETKWEMINFINFPETFINNMLDLFHYIRNEIDREYQVNHDMIQDYYEKVRKDIEEQKENFLKDDPYYNELLRNHSHAIIQYSVVLFLPYSIQYVWDNRNLNIYLGYEYEKKIDYFDNEKIDIIAFFKSFTDETRNRILQLITHQDLSAGDIGKELEVSASSLSHHLDVLMEAKIVKRMNKGKKSFFVLNKDAIMLAIRELTKLINPY